MPSLRSEKPSVTSVRDRNCCVWCATRYRRDTEKVRFGIVQVGIPEVVPEITQALKAEYGDHVDVLSAPATPVIATHTGTGAWGVAWLVED